MKFAVRVKEVLTRVVVIEASDYLEAEDKITDAYNHGDLQLHDGNSSVDLELENHTDEYHEIFGENFESMDVSEEFQETVANKLEINQQREINSNILAKQFVSD